MNEITISPQCITTKTIEDCKKQASERLRQIEEARKVINIVANIVRNYKGPKNAALCTKINKNTEILELFPGWPKCFGVKFETLYSGSKDYSKMWMWCNTNKFLDQLCIYLNETCHSSVIIDPQCFERGVKSWFNCLNKRAVEAEVLLLEAERGLKNFKDFFEKLEALKNEYKNVLDTFYIHNFPYNGKLSIY